MKQSDKKLAIFLILLSIVGMTLYFTLPIIFEPTSDVSFSLRNNDKIEHEVLVEIIDPSSTSIFKETYVLNSSEAMSSPNVEIKLTGGYKLEATLDNDTNKTYKQYIGSGEHHDIYITGNPDKLFEVEISIE